ncbi:MAG: hypothetical protein GY824_08730, partial [Delftia sp.]|nr:hypothetical protein [Delftia sp.]
VALLASLPTYAATVAARGLSQSLQETSSAERNILVINLVGQTSAGLYGAIQDALGDLIAERVRVRERTAAFESLLVETLGDDGKLQTQAITPPSGYGSSRSAHKVWMWTLDNFSHSVRLVKGEMPQAASIDEQANFVKLPPMQAVIGVQTAAKTGLGIGSRLYVKYDTGLELHIVGIVEPLDPDADMWWSDLTGFGIRQRLADPTSLDPGEETVTIPVIIPPSAMTRFIPYNQSHWRVL